MKNYEFGASGLKLGERVEVLMTGQRGVLIAEIVHISGCNTYLVLLPGVTKYGRKKVVNRDHLLLRKLEPEESVFDKTKELTDENTFSPKGIDVNAEWIFAAVEDEKEYIPEIDDAVGIEEIAIRPGMEVWNKVYGMPMIVSHVYRTIFSKELVYGLMYTQDDTEESVYSHAYGLVPMEQKIDLRLDSEEKKGALFEESLDNIDCENILARGMLT